MNFNKIIAYVEGTLSETEKKQVEMFIFSNANNLALLGNMNRIHRSLGSDEMLSTFFQKKAEKVLTKIKLNNV